MRRIFFALLILFASQVEAAAKLPNINAHDVTVKVNEIMKAHASYKKLNPLLVRRILQNYIEELDPAKTYFIESDIHEWLEPSDQVVEHVLEGYASSQFDVFEDIHARMLQAIDRRAQLEKSIDIANLPKHVDASEFKDMKWATSEQELVERLRKIKALQIETTAKLSPDLKDKAMQRIAKRQNKYEEELRVLNPTMRQQLIYSNVLKASASALDTHTVYFTPGEAAQFMINVQQRLFGIGAQLRDDLNGFTVVKIVEGGPAARTKLLKPKDRIIAVNGEPVIGMDIVDAVELIRGAENTPVTLTVIRELTPPVLAAGGEVDAVGALPTEEALQIMVLRGEVIITEARYESSYEPFGEGVIATLRLHSFYQDEEHSSAKDLESAINLLKEEHKVLGVILDLRYNSGGLLAQAVDVTGLFITKGTVVSIKDDTGSIQHLRHMDSKVAWDGPLIVLVNRASASASEIVAQTLQDYGRALITGDDHTYGKGSFQTFTLTGTSKSGVNQQGEYKVTRGRYYTVSGKTPQLVGVIPDVVVPGPLSEVEIGEKYAKYPLENDQIKDNYDDDLSDIPFLQRSKMRGLYKFDLQKRLDTYTPFLATLKKNSEIRLKNNINYQNFLKELLKKDKDVEEDESENFGQNDLQLTENYNIMKDLIILMLQQ